MNGKFLPNKVTLNLFQFFRKAIVVGPDEGVVYSNEKLAEIAGMPVDSGTKGGNYLDSAIRRMASEHNIILARIHGAACVKHLIGQEAVEHANKEHKSAHRKEKKAVRAITSVSPEETDDPQATRALALLYTQALNISAPKMRRKMLARKNEHDPGQALQAMLTVTGNDTSEDE